MKLKLLKTGKKKMKRSLRIQKPFLSLHYIILHLFEGVPGLVLKAIDLREFSRLIPRNLRC